MDMKGDYTIEASRQRVWDALNEPEILKQCIPGCEEIEKISDISFTAKVTAKVGPVKAKFTGAVTLSDFDPPNGYRISGEGKGGAAGFAKGDAAVILSDAEGGRTTLHYDVSAQVGGKLAQIGSRLVDATAKKMAGEFFHTFGRIVEQEFEGDRTDLEVVLSSTSKQGDKNMTDDKHINENVYPGTHWAVWLSSAIALLTLIYFVTNL